MRNGPWDREPPSVHQIRALGVKSLKFHAVILLAFIATSIIVVVAAYNSPPSQFLDLATAAALLMGALPFARGYPALLRQWRSLGDSHRGLGLSDLHYATLTVHTLLVAVPLVSAGWIIANALTV